MKKLVVFHEDRYGNGAIFVFSLNMLFLLMNIVFLGMNGLAFKSIAHVTAIIFHIVMLCTTLKVIEVEETK
jgi:hypothetical protein